MNNQNVCISRLEVLEMTENALFLLIPSKHLAQLQEILSKKVFIKQINLKEWTETNDN